MGWGKVHRENKMDTTGIFRSLHDRDFQEAKQGIEKEVGLVWISGGRKDHDFGWGKIRDGGRQLF